MMRMPARIATSVLAGVLALPVVHALADSAATGDRARSRERRVADPAGRARSRQVFAYPARAIRDVDFTKTPHDDNPYHLDPRFVECTYAPKPTKATSPKFDCELPGGEVVKVKYETLEIQAEVAATRLLAGLGFGVDHVMLVERLRCHGCPADPFRTRRALEYFSMGFLLDRSRDLSGDARFRVGGGRTALSGPRVRDRQFHRLARQRARRGGSAARRRDA